MTSVATLPADQLRSNLYDQIELLEAKLKDSNFASDENGNVANGLSVIICNQIDELETQISETWIK